MTLSSLCGCMPNAANLRTLGRPSIYICCHEKPYKSTKCLEFVVTAMFCPWAICMTNAINLRRFSHCLPIRPIADSCHIVQQQVIISRSRVLFDWVFEDQAKWPSISYFISAFFKDHYKASAQISNANTPIVQSIYRGAANRTHLSR